jgi:hypothetical protein
MARCPVVCVWPNGKSFGVTESEAVEIVADDLGEWDGRRTVRMKSVIRCGGRLSLRVGAQLAEAANRGEAWARAMLQEIQR